jgi:hypothetical protein
MADEWKEQAGSDYWKPAQKDDAVEGVVSEIADGQYGKEYTVRKGDGEEITLPAHAVLLAKMKSCC